MKNAEYVGSLFEEWRPIPGYEDKYEVSNEGKVRSLNYRHTGKTKELRARKDKYDYLCIGLWKDGEKKWYKIHRLVYEAFRGPIPSGLQINHLDENKLNNWLSNLEVCTPSENVNYGTRNERAGKAIAKANKKALIGKNINNPSLSKDVNQIDIVSGEVLNTFPSTREAERQTGINQGSITKCCLNKPWYKSAGGFVWKYAE